VALPLGANSVALSVAAVGLIIRLPMGFWLASRRGQVSFSDLATAILPSAFAALCVAVSVYFVRQSTPASVPLVPAMILAIGAGLAACVLAYVLLPQIRRALARFSELARMMREQKPESVADLSGLGETASS
jgi:hypothetical protein